MKLIRQLLPLLIITLALLIAYIIYSNKPAAKRRPSHPKALTVETIKLQAKNFPVLIHTQGVVEPRTTTTIIPRVSGEVIKVSPQFRPGGFFEPGDTLLTIDPTDYSLDIKTAQANLAEAQFNFAEEQAQANQAADNWKRLARVDKPSDLVLHKPQLARAQAVADSAKAQLQKAQLNLQRTHIKAPYAGRILEQFVDRGQYVSPGISLAKIFAIDYVEIRLPITEKQRGMIDLPRPYRGEAKKSYKGPEAIIYASIGGTNYQWKGQVVRTEGSVDRATRQVFVIVQVNNPYQRQSDDRPPLEIGQFVKADIKGRQLENVYAIPRTAVQGNDTIMVVDKESRLHRKKINVIWETQDQLLVKQNLTSGEQLCVTYIPFAADNAKVKLASELGKDKKSPATQNAYHKNKQHK